MGGEHQGEEIDGGGEGRGRKGKIETMHRSVEEEVCVRFLLLSTVTHVFSRYGGIINYYFGRIWLHCEDAILLFEYLETRLFINVIEPGL